MPPHHHRHHRHGPRGPAHSGSEDFVNMRSILDRVFGPETGFELARMASHGPVEIRAGFRAAVGTLAAQSDTLADLGGDAGAICSQLVTYDDEGLPTVDAAAVMSVLERYCSPACARTTLHGVSYGPDEVVALDIVVVATTVLAWAIRDDRQQFKHAPGVAAE